MALELKSYYKFVIVFVLLNASHFVGVTGLVIDMDLFEEVKWFTRFSDAFDEKGVVFKNEIDVSLQSENWDLELQLGSKSREHFVQLTMDNERSLIVHDCLLKVADHKITTIDNRKVGHGISWSNSHAGTKTKHQVGSMSLVEAFLEILFS